MIGPSDEAPHHSIPFRTDEKRLDKAVIRGTTERLTQPGKVALVYSHPSEAVEWRDYIEDLQTRKYLTRDVEDLELDELQGAQGLRALRVTVDLASGEVDKRARLAGVSAAVPGTAA